MANLSNPESQPTRIVLQRVADNLREIIQMDVGVDPAWVWNTGSVARILKGDHDFRVSTLVGVAGELGYDIVVHFRERPRTRAERGPEGREAGR